MRKVRRISSGQKYRSFVGTDFSYADLGSRNIDKYAYSIAGTDTVRDKFCYVLESRAREGADTQYRRIVSKVDTVSWIPLEADLYVESDQPTKHLISENLEQVSGFWIARKLTMSNLQKKTKTVLRFQEVRINTGLEVNTFTQRNLKR